MVKNEIYRKLIHLFAIIIPVLYYFVVKSDIISISILLPIALFCVVVDATRMESPKIKNKFYKVFGAQLRDNETTSLTGASYLLTSSVVVIAIFTKEIAFLAISYLVVGDTCAAMLGLKMGKRKIRRTRKTIEGLIGSFLSCTIYGLICYFLFLRKVFAFNNPHPQLAIIMIVFGALIASITEVSDLHINDNITIPIISGIAMSIIYFFI
ncbi:MAG: phosphatidate cytidylyltransferase [Candidatus Cloacimonetes bacterium]|nr:phosphatidate cytidylyltransferase [Candidatus Cloacimonadota bacterium]MBL7086672.1 phosphatidate cytidylyltransferase [Candidatus Cloacimonadota bacterium]